MLRKCGEAHKQPLVFEHGNPVADGFGGLRWNYGPNRRANFVQGAPGGLRNALEVFVRALGSDLSSEVVFFMRPRTTK